MAAAAATKRVPALAAPPLLLSSTSAALAATALAPGAAAVVPHPRRNWYAGAYAEIKALNPRFPFLLRPADGAGASASAAGAGGGAGAAAPPVLFVEYDFGTKVRIDLAGLSEAQIDAALRDAVLAGDAMPRAHHQSQAPLRLPGVVD